MKIISVPNTPLTNKNGEVNSDWRVFFNQLVQQLQLYLSDERYISPQPPPDRISALNRENNKGGILYNKDTNTGMINLKSTSGTDTSHTYQPIATLVNTLTNAEVAALSADSRDGRFFETTDTHELKVWINGTLKTVTIT